MRCENFCALLQERRAAVGVSSKDFFEIFIRFLGPILDERMSLKVVVCFFSRQLQCKLCLPLRPRNKVFSVFHCSSYYLPRSIVCRDWR